MPAIEGAAQASDDDSSRRLAIDLIVEAGEWGGGEGLIEAGLRAYAVAAPEARPARMSLVLADDAVQRRLNREFRGHDHSTNVLSFPAGPHDEPGFLGDVVLASETVAAEAEAAGISFDHHAAHLVVHGVLHLLGHDHGDDADAERMEALEKRILAGLGIADPHARGTSDSEA